MGKVGFVILHYNTTEDTIACVDSIIQMYSNYDIVIEIVDNGSPNLSGGILKNKYKNIDYIDVLILDRNEGFSAGNNIGCKKLLQSENLDFLIVCNNDLVFVDTRFIDGIVEAYKQYGYDVLGPDIVDAEKRRHQNPRRLSDLRKVDIYKDIFISKFMLNVHNGHFIEKNIYKFSQLVKKRIGKDHIIDTEVQNSKPDEILTDIVLYGACIVFSQKYTTKFEEIFPSQTFLYYEEDFLKLRVNKHNLISIYYPRIEVIHKESVATKKTTDGIVGKQIFSLTHSLDSALLLLKEYEKNNIK